MKPASTAPREGGPRTGYASRRPSIAPVGPSHPSSSESPSAPSGASNPGRPMRRSPAGSQPCSPSLSQPLGRDADPEGSGLMRLGKRGHKFKTPESHRIAANRREFDTCVDSLGRVRAGFVPPDDNTTQGRSRRAKTGFSWRQQVCRTVNGRPWGPSEACRAGKLGRVSVTWRRRPNLSAGLGLEIVIRKVPSRAGGAVADGEDANRIALEAQPALQ
jgi:hypothetical protein